MKWQSKKAFTLIELLIIVAIISLLTSIILNNLNNARSKARDSRRLTDMQEILKALALYYNKYNRYPGPVSSWGEGGCSWDSSGRDTDGDGKYWIEPLEDEGFLSEVPVDPQNTGDCSAPSYAYYRYNAGSSGCDASRGNFFVLGIRNMENSNLPHPASPGWNCPSRNWQNEFEWVTGGFEN